MNTQALKITTDAESLSNGMNDASRLDTVANKVDGFDLALKLSG